MQTIVSPASISSSAVAIAARPDANANPPQVRSSASESPERSSVAMQRAIGSDINMVLDQCIPSTAPYEQAEAAMHLTHRWAVRSLAARGDGPQAMFGIVQGACHHDLRKQSAAYLTKLPFDGLAIGGLAVGETHAERYEFTGFVTDFLPKTLPRYQKMAL